MLLEKAYFGGGCFWCTEALFESIPGVENVISGYAGGHTENPSYDDVSHKSTGHAEVIEVHFNPEVVSYQDLVEIFFEVHDPTTLNQQGADIGAQYRSIILTTNEEQNTIAQRIKNMVDIDGTFSDPVVTEITPLNTFYQAEEYHQDYYSSNPEKGYCQLVISPKLQKLRKKLAERNLI